MHQADFRTSLLIKAELETQLTIFGLVRFEGKLSPRDFVEVTKAMPKNGNLESISFSSTKLGYAAAAPLIEAVNQCKSLRYLK